MASTYSKPDFEQLIDALPETADVLSTAVQLLSESGDELQAEAILRNALHRAPMSTLRIALARVLMHQERYKEAMTEMVNVLRTESENAEALLMLAAALMECGELERGGKMLQKARMAGIGGDEVREVEDRWRELTSQGRRHDQTEPEFDRPADVNLEPPKRRHETLMGRPTGAPLVRPVSAPAAAPSAPPPGRKAVPPPLESGSFASLDTWDISADENDLDTTAIAPEKVRLTANGPMERVPPPPVPTQQAALKEVANYATPDDQTAAIILEDDYADDQTEHIAFNDVQQAERHRQESGQNAFEPMPSVEYDANFAAEAHEHQQASHRPPADLDDLPAWDSDINRYPIEDGWDDFAPKADARAELAHDDWDNIPAMDADFTPPPQQYQQPSGPNPGFGGGNNHSYTPPPQHQQQYTPQEQPAQPQYQPAPQRREETAVAAEPREPAAASTSLRVLVKRRWPLMAFVFVAIVLCGFLGITVASGMSLGSALERGLATSFEAREPDTFNGFVAAEEALVGVSKAESFMGAKFDEFVESTVPIPGLGSKNLRQRGVSELAAVTAVLEYRFERVGDRGAQDRLAAAKAIAPNHPATAAAEGYLALAENKPAQAISLLEAATSKHPDASDVTEALAWANLALDRPADASKAAEALRTQKEPSVRVRFLLASIDAARGDAKAADAFAVVFAESPDHADARIGRAYTLFDNKAKLGDAQRALDAVLTKLADTTSNFQKARATSAYGSFHLASGKPDAAEERFRSAIAKMPTRGELYLPLVRFLVQQNKVEEAYALLKKARDNNAFVPDLAYYEAELRIMGSKPEVALQVLDKLDFEDGRRAFLRGLALQHQHNYAAAAKVLKKAQAAPGDPVNALALLHLVDAFVATPSDSAKDEPADKSGLAASTYKLGELKTKNADNAIVHWAAAVVEAQSARVTASKKTRSAQLAAARADIKRAIELDASWAPAHVTHCEILLLELDTEAAEEACKTARELAPDYTPALVATARLRLLVGKYEAAKELSDRALELRPEDSVVGHLAARVAIELRQLDVAKQQIDRFLGKEVDPYEQALLEGRLEFARENYTRAAGYLQEAQRLRPNDGEASIYFGHTLARLGNEKEAGPLLKEYLDHPIWSGYAWAVLGEVRRKQKRLKDAYENLDKALAIYKTQSVPSRYYSHAYTEYALANRIKYRKWNNSNVKRMLQRGEKLGDPADPGLNMTFGQYYLNLRKPDYGLAMEYIQKVVDVAPYRCDAVDALLSLYTRAKRDQANIDALRELQSENCAKEPKK